MQTQCLRSTNRDLQKRDLFRGTQSLQSVRYVCSTLGKAVLCLTGGRCASPGVCLQRSPWLQLHFNAVLSLFTRGHQRSGFSLSTCGRLCAVNSQEPLNSVDLFIMTCALLFLLTTTQAHPFYLALNYCVLQILSTHYNQQDHLMHQGILFLNTF